MGWAVLQINIKEMLDVENAMILIQDAIPAQIDSSAVHAFQDII